MNRQSRALGMFACALSLLAAALFAPVASADTVGVDLRVLTDTGNSLTDIRQYTDTTAVPTSPKAECFGPGSGGSGTPRTINGPTALGALSDASRANGSLNPFLVTDKFLDSLGSLGVCAVGGVSFASDFSNFWQVRVDHKATQKGGDLVPVDDGADG